MLSSPNAFQLWCMLSKRGSCSNQIVGAECHISWGWEVVYFRREAWKRQCLTHVWRRQWQPISVLLPGKSHGWRSLVGCSPCVAKSQARLSNFTLTFHFHALEKEMATHSSILAWRIPGTQEPSVYGVAQSQTRLKRLRNSSSSNPCQESRGGRGRMKRQ